MADQGSTAVDESARSDMAEQGERTHLGADAWGALLRVHAAVVPMLDRELQAAGRLPLAWYDVLLELNSAPGRRLRMSDLGEKVTLSRTRVSRLVDELGTAGLVTREANPDDRRSAYAVLTTQGRTTLRGAAPVYLGGIREHFADLLSAEELRTITAALDRVIAQARRSKRAGSYAGDAGDAGDG
jgi:DNA-binding MarR family transcriptional regulator